MDTDSCVCCHLLWLWFTIALHEGHKAPVKLLKMQMLGENTYACCQVARWDLRRFNGILSPYFWFKNNTFLQAQCGLFMFKNIIHSKTHTHHCCKCQSDKVNRLSDTHLSCLCNQAQLFILHHFITTSSNYFNLNFSHCHIVHISAIIFYD